MRSIIVLIAFSVLSGCTRSTQDKISDLKRNLNLVEKIQDHKTKKVINAQKPKIITFIDGRCNVCLDDLRLWDILSRDTVFKQQNTDIVYYIGVQNKQSIDIWLRLHSVKNLILDSDRLFLTENGLDLDEKILHTFLLDRNNRVVLVGSPIGNPKMWTLYKQTIAKLAANDEQLSSAATMQ